MRVTRKLLREHFGEDADISGWFGSYRVKMPTGGSIDIASNGEMKNFRGGPEIYIPSMRLARALGYTSLTVSGNPRHIAAALMYGQAEALDIGVKQKRSWLFGGSGIQVPHPSGAHGSAGLATPEMLRAAGLTGGTWGHGLRFGGEDDAGNLLRYMRPSSVLLVGPTRSGKQRDCITAALVEGEKTSFFVVDPKCELLAVTKRGAVAARQGSLARSIQGRPARKPWAFCR